MKTILHALSAGNIEVENSRRLADLKQLDATRIFLKKMDTKQPNFNELLDPKCDWALRHLDQFPVDVERASYPVLLRVPGIGPKSASRITHARQYGRLDFDSLKKMGVVLKRAHYFITCGGRQMYHTPIEQEYITRQLVTVDKNDLWKIRHSGES